MNPAFRERQLIVGNLLFRLCEQPLAALLLGVFGLVLGLLIVVVFQQLGQQDHTALSASLQRWPFLLCLAMQRPAWHREWVAAQTGWMAAWRDEPSALTWRPLAVLLVFGLVSTSRPLLSPMIWLLLMAGLIRLVVKLRNAVGVGSRARLASALDSLHVAARRV